MAEEFLILPHPSFLSQKLLNYLTKVSQQAGRYVVFCDGRVPTPEAIASIQIPEEMPAAAIIIRDLEFRQSTYDSVKHDPVLAHEITHLALHAQSWPLMSFPENLDDFSRAKANTVHNWLTDPLINAKIDGLGFSLVENRRSELEDTIRTVSDPKCRYVPMDESRKFFGIRLMVSFVLEPGLSTGRKKLLRKLFRANLPDLSEIAERVLATIMGSDWTTPEGYVGTATECLRLLGVDLSQIHYEAMVKYTEDECVTWAAAHAVPEVEWG